MAANGSPYRQLIPAVRGVRAEACPEQGPGDRSRNGTNTKVVNRPLGGRAIAEVPVAIEGEQLLPGHGLDPQQPQ